MANNEKSPKEKFDATVKTVAEKAKTKTGKIVGIIILVIVVLNVFWSMMENRVVSEVQALRTEIALRLNEVEKGSIDPEAVKADAEAIRKVGADFEAKMNAIVKAEETKLEALTRDMESQKAYLETLKKFLAGEAAE